MVSQHGGGEEEKRKVEGMCRLHRFEQSMSERPFPHALDWPADGCHCRSSLDELFGCISRIPSNTSSHGRSRDDSFCHSYWELPLQSDAFWFEKCKRYLPKDDDQNVWVTIREKHWDLYDMVVKSKVESEHVNDLKNIFDILRRHKL